MDAKEVIDICLRKRLNWSLVPNRNQLYVAIQGCDIILGKSSSNKGFIKDEIEISCQCWLNDYSHRIRLRFNQYCEDYELLEKAYNQAIKKIENRITK